jgi:tetratricopeptide (TPR) repeat protein
VTEETLVEVRVNYTIFFLLAIAVPSSAWAQPFELQPIPSPDLSAMAEPVRREIERLTAAVDTLVEHGDLPPTDLGRAFTTLGEVYQAHGLLNPASAAYSNARKLNPQDGLPIFHLGRIHRERGDWAAAATAFKEVISLSPDDLTARIQLGEVQLDLQETEAAAQSFRLVLQTDAASAAAWFGLGRAVAARGDLEEAVRHFHQALELQPEASIIHYPLALAYRSLGNLEEARSHLELRGEEPVRIDDPRLDRLSRIAALSAVGAVLALAADREDFSARNFLGFTVDQLGETVGSIELLEAVAKAREVDPSGEGTVETARIHFAIGGLLAYQGKETEAITHFRAATEILPSFQEAQVKLGDALARSGDFSAAVAAYDRALAVDPDNPTTLLRRATALAKQGEERAAVTDLERVTELDPQAAEGWFHLAAAHERLANPSAAARAYETALALDLADPEQSFAHLRLGDLLQQRGDLAAALGQYEAALQIEPAATKARLELAGILGRLDRYDEAADEYAQVVTAKPRHEAARLGEVSALVFAGRWEEAGQRLESGHQALPESRNLAHLLARLLAAAPEPSLRDGSRALEIVEPLFAERRSLFVGETVAMALAESGDPERSVTLQRSLLAAARKAGLAAVAERLEANLALYEKGEACCTRKGPVSFLPPLESTGPNSADRESTDRP